MTDEFAAISSSPYTVKGSTDFDLAPSVCIEVPCERGHFKIPVKLLMIYNVFIFKSFTNLISFISNIFLNLI